MWWPKNWYFWCITIAVIILNLSVNVYAELTPPYFNLATGRKIYASATCGEGFEGPELYCKLVGANTEHDHIDYSVIQGQVCDFCDPSVPEKNHAPEYAIDGTEAWWMSPPLSRGMKYNEVNLTIDFGQEFHVAYLFIRMGNSPRPGLWTLERSSDYGKTWKPWQHFSDTSADCETYFGKDTYKPIKNDDDVICTTEYSKIVPLENGEIPVMLLNDRPSSTNYFNSTVLQEWTRATNVRIRLLRTKNLLGHLMSMSRQDPTVTRRYFYSIKDISIGGRCMCNGHADTCDVLDPKSPVRILACRCQHQTCGIQCNECCPGFLQKRWRQNTNAGPFECEPCNCHGHTNECIYDEEIDRKGLSLDIHGYYSGGGVCKNCQHNTEGINCNKCKDKYYRPAGKYWNETNVCKPCECDYFYSTGRCEELTGRCECKTAYQPPNCDSCAYGYYGYPNCKECECNLNGTDGYHCESINGECPCKYNFAGKYCKQCAEGFYGFPECKACDCNKIGAVSDNCDMETGQCKCLSSFGGDHCERCNHGNFDYPNCIYCQCDFKGTEAEICNKQSGTCICREGFGGSRCDQCLPGFFNYPECTPCNCSLTGSTATTCDNTGKCNCLPNYAGKKCTLCSAGFFSYPECLSCNCDTHGSEGVTCNADGECLCLSNFDGKLCESCKEGFYNFPSCEECNCDPAGVIDSFAGCGSVPVGKLCECKERVSGRICNECKPLYWNLNISNPDGCDTCDCWTDGTLATLDTCESKTGQCTCKPHTAGRTCRECSEGTYDLDAASLFGCKPCNCDVGGTQEPGCDPIKGQCKCYPRITGRACTQPLTTHYFPTLHQFQYEFEDGAQLSGAQVRYEYNEKIFPEFSSRGYAVFNDIQNEIRNEVTVFKSEVYRVIIRYVNNNPENITASILIQSENPLEVDQNIKIRLHPTTQPQFATVAGPKGIKPSAIVLDPGKYIFTTKASNNIMLDYFALLPSAYYEASILTRKILTPCEFGNMELCRHYKYPSLQDYSPQMTPFVTAANGTPHRPQEYYNEPEHLANINHVGDIPVLTSGQPHLKYNIDVPRSGYYIFVVDYVSEINYAEPYFIKFSLENNEDDYGSTQLYPCLYSMACRTPIIDENSREKVFYISKDNPEPVVISTIDDNTDDSIPIVSVTAIPVEQYSIDFINPSPVCVISNGVCVNRKFPTVPDSKRIEFETDHEDRISLNKPPYAVLNERVKLVQISSRQNASILVESTLPERKRYVIVVKYYQPDHAKFQILYNLTTGKNQYDGKFDVKHCPASAGCLGVIYSNSEDWWFDLDKDFKLSLTNMRPNMLWLDYVLVVPVNQFNDDLLQEETFDQTEEFIKNCGQDHFHITHNASEFCKQAVFSLTAGYNGGALSCSCNDKGSTSFECHPFGGQCQCKPNVIGRQCDACRTGYYGFPDCKPCDCPITAMCEQNTGECVCPPNVMGDLCDKCMPNTYGFHQIIGCELCNCSPQGIANGITQCDMFNGSCVCRPNIEGRACDKCQSGYFDYPMCDKCTCNTAGTEMEICDKFDGSCICKKNVVGRDCEQCVSGTYNLQTNNPEGCTTCFCFGKTSRCESYQLPVYNVSLLRKLNVHIAHFQSNSIEFEYLDIPQEELLVNETSALLDFSQLDLAVGETSNSVLYFGALDYLLNQNNHISAYGGELGYSLFFTTGLSGNPLFHPDVILLSKRNILVHHSYDQPSSNQIFRNSVQMIETNFRTQDGKPVNRAEFMMVLRELDMIFVRANYWEQTIVTQLSDIYLTLADDGNVQDEDGLAYHASDYSLLVVERCQCPPGYDGLSCQDCAPGYYRDPSGPYGGYCIKCECNGHSDTCDCATGKCTNCQHSTTGDHCEKCLEGYHGNATNGGPNDCIICACPLPFIDNNFSTGCEISESGNEVHCECKPGYTGALCESCSNGFHGNPQTPGDYCKPCDCSGNIDTNEIGSCDTKTGECLRCLNNTYGTACNLCAPGFYGDAINAKNCRSCNCEELGTLSCDPAMGECKCHDNVVGDNCNRCEDDHYGYDSGVGCRACECGLASNATQCDYHTGNCACKPGVTGRQCERCAVDHWNYTAEGCTPCRCNEGYSRGFGCNPLTGQCECLPNVIGDRCNTCPHRSVLIKDEGCFKCDTCHGALLDVTDRLGYELDPVILKFESVALAFFTNQKLNNYYQTTGEIEQKVLAFDPESVNLRPSQDNATKLEADIKEHGRQRVFNKDTALERSITSAALLKNITELSNETRHRGAEARVAIAKVESLFHNSAAPASSLETAFEEAKRILQNINDTKIDLLPNEKLLQRAQNLLDDVDDNMQPIISENQTLEALKNDIGDFSDKLEDLYNRTLKSAKEFYEVDTLNSRNNMSLKNSQFELVAELEKTAKDNIDKAGNDTINGDLTLEAIEKNLEQLNSALKNLKDINKNIDGQLSNIEGEQKEVANLTDYAEVAAANLNEQAAHLSDEYAHMTANAEPAIKAATAYSGIVDAVLSASLLAAAASETARNFTGINDGLKERAILAHNNSDEQLQKAQTALMKVQSELESRWNISNDKVNNITEINDNTQKQLKEINIIIEQLLFNTDETLRDTLKNSHNNASDAIAMMKDVIMELKPVGAYALSELENARNVSKDIDVTNKDISEIEHQIHNVTSNLLKLNDLADIINDNQVNVENIRQSLDDKVLDLKLQIDAARRIANDIKVGVHFTNSTVLELKPPETLQLLATKSKISAYFKTDKPNGFLIYLGNDNNKTILNQKSNDYLALEVANGYPVLVYDLGNGSKRLTNKKYVADDNWYQAIIDRSGSDVKLIIREELDNGTIIEHVEHADLSEPSTIFNVDRNSRLFVGGYPSPNDFTAPEDIESSSFEGDIEDLRIGDEHVGLFNFVYGEDNNIGTRARNKLLSDERPPTGYRFNGIGYISMKATPYNFRQRTTIEFKFKADKDTKDGLLFYYGRHHHFMSIELIDGNVFFRFKLGDKHLISSGTQSDKPYNDNEWHRVIAAREGRSGLLKVDGVLIFQEEAAAQADESMPNVMHMYFGGTPGMRNNSIIVPQNFEGCIDDVTIGGTKVDLSQHVNAVGVKPGCPPKFATTLSFAPHQYGYLRSSQINANNNFNLQLTFRTRQPQGILFYATNHNQSAAIALTLNEGYLSLRSMGNEVRSDQRPLNDGEDHIVTVRHIDQELRLSIDEIEDKFLSSSPGPLIIQHGDIFFGGLPNNYTPQRKALATLAYFVGCISDVTINGEIINFAESTEKFQGNTHSSDCPADLLAYEPNSVPIYFPDGTSTQYDAEFNVPLAEFNYVQPLPTNAPETLIPINITTTTASTSTAAILAETTPSPYINMINDTDMDTAKPKLIKKKKEGCALPTNPNFDVDFEESGYRFAVIKDQRLEITPNPPIRMKKHYDILLSFRTSNDSGLLFYASDNQHKDYIAVFLQRAHIIYSVRIGTIVVNIESEMEVNDMNWHTIQFTRNRKISLWLDNVEQEGSLELEDKQVVFVMSVEFPVYVGGVPKGMEQLVRKNIDMDEGNNAIKLSNSGFPYYSGCIRDIKMNNVLKKPNIYNVVPCSENIENGLFFNKPNSYIKLFDSFNVSTDFSMSFDFKPREANGLLFSVHGKHAHMILELVDNHLSFTVKSDAKNKVQTNYTLSDGGNFCDGKWRNVLAVKSKFVITISVEYMSTSPSIGTPGVVSTNTHRPLFLGGHQFIHKVPGLQTRKGFVGCIRNLQVNKKNVKISSEQIYGDVWHGVCPLN